MNTPTQGPYTAGLMVSGRGLSIHIQGAGGKVVASVGNHDIADSVDRMYQVTDTNEIRANAYLFAAAPEMYDALKKLVNALPDSVIEEMRPVWGNTNASDTQRRRDIAKAAIAKADNI